MMLQYASVDFSASKFPVPSMHSSLLRGPQYSKGIIALKTTLQGGFLVDFQIHYDPNRNHIDRVIIRHVDGDGHPISIPRRPQSEESCSMQEAFFLHLHQEISAICNASPALKGNLPSMRFVQLLLTQMEVNLRLEYTGLEALWEALSSIRLIIELMAKCHKIINRDSDRTIEKAKRSETHKVLKHQVNALRLGADDLSLIETQVEVLKGHLIFLIEYPHLSFHKDWMYVREHLSDCQMFCLPPVQCLKRIMTRQSLEKKVEMLECLGRSLSTERRGYPEIQNKINVFLEGLNKSLDAVMERLAILSEIKEEHYKSSKKLLKKYALVVTELCNSWGRSELFNEGSDASDSSVPLSIPSLYAVVMENEYKAEAEVAGISQLSMLSMFKSPQNLQQQSNVNQPLLAENKHESTTFNIK